MALGCMYASNSGLCVTDVLRCLPVTVRAATVAALLRSHHTVCHERLHEALATLRSDRRFTREEAWVVLQAMTVVSDVSSVVEVRWIAEVIRCVVFGDGGGSSSSSAELRVRTMTALRLGECVLTAEALALLCEESELWYESAAYRSSAAGVLLETVEDKGRRRNGCGFGPDMIVFLRAVRNGDATAPPPPSYTFSTSSSSSSIGSIEALRKTMPPMVATYTMDRVVAELTRREWGNACGTAVEENASSNIGNNNRSNGASATALQYVQTAAPLSDDAVSALAPRLHFELRLGSASTALALLPSCRSSWNCIVRLMQHTHHAGVVMALDALRGLMDLSPSDCYYVMVRF
ncbi:putative TPR-repeat-containing chaperone protein DNAJ [Trypanosoma rangeli]|uniref:Putative TPR-repeat-containing chaperone protein DNAJ n=1 Tax=Trypanosoma rangeli TaxID=5698 RepID=A0A3R7LAL2_TRYRA|nr:putative TPR-repeat-containing chaperone protein DNAJ [Trypanosoma rangeli]RNF10472.1 putative TPR-repeat-containing chaperone protein DNAJ [Trypanosoma rangeli]|eukprot:RNF10472.1 putative TPR-repeat-containing chaperone protein DNAJ [Trypanosoma rangeli]